MLKNYCYKTGNNWDEGVPFCSLARDAKQESLEFSPAELVSCHNVRGPLKVFKEKLGVITPVKIMFDFVTRCRASALCYKVSQAVTLFLRSTRRDAVTRRQSSDAGD